MFKKHTPAPAVAPATPAIDAFEAKLNGAHASAAASLSLFEVIANDLAAAAVEAAEVSVAAHTKVEELRTEAAELELLAEKASADVDSLLAKGRKIRELFA